jgi:hypothetical protein
VDPPRGTEAAGSDGTRMTIGQIKKKKDNARGKNLCGPYFFN